MEADLLGGDFAAAPAPPPPPGNDPFAPPPPQTQAQQPPPPAQQQQPPAFAAPPPQQETVAVQPQETTVYPPVQPQQETVYPPVEQQQTFPSEAVATSDSAAATSGGGDFDAFAAPAVAATSDDAATQKAIRESSNDAVAGVAVAEKHPFKMVAGFPREIDLADMILPLPETVHDQVLCPDVLPRLLEVGYLVKFGVEHDKKKKLISRHDSFTVTDAMGQPFHGIVAMEEHNKLMGRSNRIVFYDNTKQPILLARQKRNINRKYLILGRSKLLKDDVAEEHEDGVPFYPWFMVRDIDDSHLKFRSVQVWNGNNYQPLYHIKSASSKGQPGGKLRVPKKDDLRLTGCNDHDRVYALFSRKLVEKGQDGEKVTGWDAAVAPGVDVALCLALSIILDDMVRLMV